jgi:hypothetical protein
MDFFEACDLYRGEDASDFDIMAPIVPVYEYDLLNYGPLRMWPGMGTLITEDDREWTGTIDSRGTDHHQVPTPRDGRDGTSARMEFGLPFIDKSTYNAIRLLDEPVAGRTITVYLAILLPDEGLRPSTPLRFQAQYTMKAPLFDTGLVQINGGFVRTYNAKVVARDGYEGRSQAYRGTYSSTCQGERALELGVAVDKGCDFIAALANVTITVP